MDLSNDDEIVLKGSAAYIHEHFGNGEPGSASAKDLADETRLPIEAVRDSIRRLDNLGLLVCKGSAQNPAIRVIALSGTGEAILGGLL